MWVPFDGHDINLICTMLRRIQRHMVGPVFLHVVTQKGKGYLPAEKENSPLSWRGTF
jgi:1-deoxy-D-xylulose-5-phosphate synthase